MVIRKFFKLSRRAVEGDWQRIAVKNGMAYYQMKQGGEIYYLVARVNKEADLFVEREMRIEMSVAELKAERDIRK